MIMGIAGVVVAGFAIAVVAWQVRPDGAPRLNSDTATIAAFVATEEYAKLPFDRQQAYMKTLEDRDDNDELEKVFMLQKLSESQYRAAIQEAWLGQQLKRSEGYMALPAGPARIKYINSLLDKKVKKDQTRKRSIKSQEEEAADSIKRDATATKLRIESWPAPVREQYETFRKAYEEQKEVRDAAMTAPAGAASSTPAAK